MKPGSFLRAALICVSVSAAAADLGEFFIVSSIDLARQQILLKRPTEVTELMRVDASTRYFADRGSTLHLADIRAGDTVFIISKLSGGQPVAVSVRKGPMTLDLLRERYLKKK